MKQMQGISAQADFSLSVPAPTTAPMPNRWLVYARAKLAHIAANRRELIISAAATLAIGIGVLLTSYLFFIQLAAYGW